jgi:ribonucleoside-diphosphate reductase alpha chain
LRDAVIQGSSGTPVFEQKNVEVPVFWTQTATNIVASKYFHGIQGSPQRETSVKQVIQRIGKTITDWGKRDGYFVTDEDANTFEWELIWLLLNQYGAFNSPVFFNVGCDQYYDRGFTRESWFWDSESNAVRFGNVGYQRPQVSACFINSIEDTMESILQLNTTESLLFRGGSGSGTNFSPLRASMEALSGGGVASGPLSFMKGFDAFAGVIKSGGKTRRAAKMVILNADHPDIEAFIVCKQKEEQKAYALMREGYDGSNPDAEAYSIVAYQNANHAVRVSDEFMCLATEDSNQPWLLKAVKDGRVVKEVSAPGLLRQIAAATWACGDPGMQFDSTINTWHTCPNSGRINASNPCSEYMFLDDSSCNLASLNLLAFYSPATGTFDIERFRAAVRIFVIAQDILVDNASYPTEKITRNSHDFRPLGLGYANLGALLMARGVPYDSEHGRAYAATLTAIMTGEAYCQSARMARHLPVLTAADANLGKQTDQLLAEVSHRRTGACPGWLLNATPFLDVIRKHQSYVELHSIAPQTGVPKEFYETATRVWAEALELGKHSGYRNAQLTVLAPTGTIGFFMDCDTTGIEPVLGLVTSKKLVGGGVMTLTNRSATMALARLGYDPDVQTAITKYIAANGTVEGAPDFNQVHLPVFDCALKSTKGTRTISYLGHIKMMEAVQPFLSGAISKTINLPEEVTVEHIATAYVESWRRGLKAVAIYRDGSKKAQPVATKKEASVKAVDQATETSQPPSQPDTGAPPKAVRHRLPDERAAITHKFGIGGHEGYITIGMYPNGQPGEIFITMSKEGSTISGLMDGFAMMVSMGLQHGVPLQTVVDKLSHTRFEPSGWTKRSEIGYAKSIMDYLARYLEARFLKPQQGTLFASVGQNAVEWSDGSVSVIPPPPDKDAPPVQVVAKPPLEFGDSPVCTVCGTLMIRSGSCYKCPECFSTSGCS